MQTHPDVVMEESTASESNYNFSRETYNRLRYHSSSSESESEDVSGGTLHIDLDMFIRRRPRSPSLSICSSSGSNTTIHWLNLRVNSMTSSKSQFEVQSLAEDPNSVELSAMMETTTPSSDINELKKGPWTVEEDFKLINYIAKHGERNWRTVAKGAGLKRSGNSCRVRWLNYLHPLVRRGNISRVEQEMIIHLHKKLGNKWASIARHLPGRTANEVRNHWNTRIRKALSRSELDPLTCSPLHSRSELDPLTYSPPHPSSIFGQLQPENETVINNLQNLQ